MTYIKIQILLAITALTFLTVCSDRIETPSEGENSTTIFRSKSANGIEASIIFCKGISKKSGEPIKADTVFNLKEKEKVYSVINLSNRKLNIDKDLMFHVDWLDSTGNSFYKKRIDLTPSDTSATLSSSISISPDKRNVGKYSIRIYLFRELIAEKYFHLGKLVKKQKEIKKEEKPKKKIISEKKDVNKKSVKPKVTNETLNASIILCGKISKKTGKPIGVGNRFTIKEKAKVKAIVTFEKPEIKPNEQMKFYFKWINPEGKIFYKKRVIYTTSNPSFSISNSISITPESKKPGTYTIQIVFKKKVIAEQKFELIVPNN
jgi:hypothetical protein